MDFALTEAHGREQLAWSCYLIATRWEIDPTTIPTPYRYTTKPPIGLTRKPTITTVGLIYSSCHYYIYLNSPGGSTFSKTTQVIKKNTKIKK